MSSSNSKRPTSSVTESTSIPEMIKQIRHTFFEREFNEIERKLMENENKMKTEMEDLIRDRDSAKEEVRLLERTQGIAELAKLKLEEKLQKSQKKCEELEERITRFIEEQKLSSDREKRAEERYAKMSEEISNITNDKKTSITELNKKIKELRNKNSESERSMGVYQEELKELKTKLLKIGLENDELRREKLATNQIVEDLKRKELETNQALEDYKMKYENLAPRLGKLEQELSAMVDLKVEEFGNSAHRKGNAFEGGNVNFPEFKGENVISRNGDNQDDTEDIVKKGSGRLFHSSSKKGLSNMAQSNAADQDNKLKRTHGSDIESKGLEGSGPHGRRQRMFGAECSNKLTSSVAADIIEISDSDDETNPCGSAKGKNVGSNETVFENFVQTPSSVQTSKRSRADYRVDLTTKKTRSEDMLPVDEKESPAHESTANRIGRSLSKDFSKARDSPTPLQKVNGLVDSSDDESCSESNIHNLLSTLRRKKNGLMP